LQSNIQLEHCTLEELPKEQQSIEPYSPFCFKLVSKINKNEIILKAENAMDKMNWVNCFKSAMESKSNKPVTSQNTSPATPHKSVSLPEYPTAPASPQPVHAHPQRSQSDSKLKSDAGQ
jgi:hypothetical protein